MSSRASVFALLLVANGALHCGSAPIPTATVAAPTAPTPDAEPAVSAPAEQLAVQPFAEAPPAAEAPSGQPATIANRLAGMWCGQGGKSFLPIGPSLATDDGYRIQSCEEVQRQATLSTPAGSIIELTVAPGFAEERRYLHVLGGDEAVLLAQAWSSGAGGFSHYIDATPPERGDVFGDDGDEVWTTVSYGWGDTDMDVCRHTGEDHQKLVLCTRDGGRLACFDLPLVDLEIDEIYGDGEGCKRPSAKRKGFAMTSAVKKGTVELARAEAKEGERITAPKTPPFKGSVSIAKLLKKAPAEIVRP